MITKEFALATGTEYVGENRTGVRVSGLYEDGTDYLVTTEPLPGFQDEVGPGHIFVSKLTGQIRIEAPGDGFHQILDMTPVS
jgi:hypothetical protein